MEVGTPVRWSQWCFRKDVNLAIALKLKDLLEQNDINVIMTRTEDIGLYSETDSNKNG